MFGDNKSVITSSTIPHSNLNKRHNALSYHRVREAISANILYLIHIDGKLNPSDILTKFLSWAKFWPLIQPLLFWKGETLKDIHPTTPITDIISKITQSPSGLWGVTSINEVSPSGNKKQIQSVLPDPQKAPTDLPVPDPKAQEIISNLQENNFHSLAFSENKFHSLSGPKVHPDYIFDNSEYRIRIPKWPFLVNPTKDSIPPTTHYDSTGSHYDTECDSTISVPVLHGWKIPTYKSQFP
jgi:hypothetical protein